MTPKEKAGHLLNSFYSKDYENYFSIELANIEAKQCAIIAVEEILHDDVYSLDPMCFDIRLDYWLGVKRELEKM
jgi:hypothetical protein